MCFSKSPVLIVSSTFSVIDVNKTGDVGREKIEVATDITFVHEGMVTVGFGTLPLN